MSALRIVVGLLVVAGAMQVVMSKQTASARGTNVALPVCSECKVCPTRPEWTKFTMVITNEPDPEKWEGDLEGWGCLEIEDGCSHDHIECDDYSHDDDQELDELAVALPSFSRDDLRDLIASRRGVVQFVTSRQAVQITGCNGVVLEHIPLADLASELEADR